MPDYSLRKNNPPQEQPTQHQPLPNRPTQEHTQSLAPMQRQDPMTQLSQASELSKKETENALLREALATSAQSYEGLTKQLITSQESHQQEAMELMKEVQIASLKMTETNNKNIVMLFEMVNEHHDRHNSHLSSLQNQNHQFSQNLDGVLKDLASKMIEQVKADTANALQANLEAMNTAVQNNLTALDDAVKSHVRAIGTAHTNMEKANTKVVNYDKHLKTLLDNRLKRSKESINKIFEVDGLKRFLFWVGIACSILTPIVLIVIFLV